MYGGVCVDVRRFYVSVKWKNAGCFFGDVSLRFCFIVELLFRPEKRQTKWYKVDLKGDSYEEEINEAIKTGNFVYDLSAASA